MDKRARMRWGAILSALIATLVAVVYPVDDSASSQPLAIPKAGAKASVKLTPTLFPVERAPQVWIANEENPFGPRVWDAPAKVTDAARDVQTVELAPVATEPATLPAPLPYRFLGQMQDGGNRIIYLGRGEEVLLAHQDDVLDGSYKVVTVSDSAIEFESVPSGVRQTLPIPAQ